MQFLTYYELNENISAEQSNEVARTLTEEGLFPPEGADVITWVGTPDGWGISLWEADDYETIHTGLNMWRVAAEEAAFFEMTKTAPAAPVEEVIQHQAALVELLE